MLTAARGKPDPACRKHAQDVSMREQRYVASLRPQPAYHSIDACTNLFRCLATRASMAEDEPARRDLVDLLGRQSLVLAVVPFNEVRVDNRLVPETRQLAGFSCALHRTAQNELKPSLSENRSHPLRMPAAIVGQRDVCRPGVLPGEAPYCFAVSDREHLHVGLRRIRCCRPLSSEGRQTSPLAPTSSP